MAMTQGGRAVDGGIGLVKSMKTDGSDETYVRIIQWLENGREVRRSTYGEDGALVKTDHFGWVNDVAQVMTTETEGPGVAEELALLREQGYIA